MHKNIECISVYAIDLLYLSNIQTFKHSNPFLASAYIIQIPLARRR